MNVAVHKKVHDICLSFTILTQSRSGPLIEIRELVIWMKRSIVNGENIYVEAR